MALRLARISQHTTIGRVKNWLAPELLEALLNAAIKQPTGHLGRRGLYIAVDDSPPGGVS